MEEDEEVGASRPICDEYDRLLVRGSWTLSFLSDNQYLARSAVSSRTLRAYSTLSMGAG